MALAIESLGYMFINISIVGFGVGAGIIALLYAMSKETVKDESERTLLFASIAIFLSIIVQSQIYGLFIMLLGVISLLMAYMPVLKELGDKNLFAMAIMALIMVVSLNAIMTVNDYGIFQREYFDSSTYYYDYDDATGQLLYDMQLDVDRTSNRIGTSTDSACSRDENNTLVCDALIKDTELDDAIFVPIASVWKIGTMAKTALNMALQILATPVVFREFLKQKATGLLNELVTLAMSLIIMIWEYAIIYKLFALITNKQGMR